LDFEGIHKRLIDLDGKNLIFAEHSFCCLVIKALIIVRVIIHMLLALSRKILGEQLQHI
jgi:hypothetical protein